MQEKNYWTLGIIGILIFGVIIVTLSIFIAMKNPVQNENAFFSTKNIIDEQINQIIQEHNQFISLYKPKIHMSNPQGQNLEHNTFVFPYNMPPHRNPSTMQKTPSNILSPYENQIDVSIQHKANQDPVRIQIFLDSLHQEDQLRLIDEPTPVAANTESTQETTTYISHLPQLPEGRWKLILEITYQTNKKAYFEAEIFVKPQLPTPL